jgi:hypothetical protein
MAEMTIRLRCDPKTGKKDIIVSLRSDEDALPLEHEQHHRALVEKLVHGGLLKPSELGQILVEREGSEGIPALPASADGEGLRESVQQGEGPV